MKARNKQTKFPVARIKRIMQKDEDVGKVAQATPVVISKALELFLARLVTETHAVSLERNSKRLEPYHLKHAIERTDLLDFLREITSNVPDPSAGGSAGGEDGEGRKKKRAPRAKTKKVKPEEDEDMHSDDE